MKTLFDQAAYQEISTRLEQLKPDTQRLWGKMNAAQMLAHCSNAIEFPLSTDKLPRKFLGRILGPFIKPTLVNDKPYKPSSPTAPNFVVEGERDFSTEKIRLTSYLKDFHQRGTAGMNPNPHPFFGTFTPKEWGITQYKHLDHHLKQFGL